MILLPIRTDSPLRRTPYVNYVLIAVNILIYLLLDVAGQAAGARWGLRIKEPLMLWPTNLELPQFLSYQFLHADRWHLLGNMFFLWLFGNSVNGKMGHLPYLLFYLAGGVFAGLGFAIGNESTPCLGASGSISAVTTAYLVMFPRSQVTVFYWFFFYVGTTQIGSLLWILGKMILWDNYFARTGSSEFTSVAYEAHLAGYLFGFVFSCLMLWLRALPRDTYDILAVIRRWYQRTTYAAAMRNPETRAQMEYGRVARGPDELRGEVPTYVEAVPTDAAGRARQSILEAISVNDFSRAAEQYVNLVTADPAQALPRQHQLTVANQLMTLGRYPQAAEAYEKYLRQYPKTTDREQVKLILGILYARYLQRFDLARPHLSESLQTLTDSNQRAQALHWLDVIGQNAPPSAQPVV